MCNPVSDGHIGSQEVSEGLSVCLGLSSTSFCLNFLLPLPLILAHRLFVALVNQGETIQLNLEFCPSDNFFSSAEINPKLAMLLTKN